MVVKKLSENDYLISLQKGEKVWSTLQKWQEENKVTSATLSGIGGVCNIKYGSTRMDGYVKTEAYDYKAYELTSLIGNMTIVHETQEYLPHFHCTWVDANFNNYGGHIFEMEVAIVCEIHVRVYPGVKVERKADSSIPHLKAIF